MKRQNKINAWVEKEYLLFINGIKMSNKWIKDTYNMAFLKSGTTTQALLF